MGVSNHFVDVLHHYRNKWHAENTDILSIQDIVFYLKSIIMKPAGQVSKLADCIKDMVLLLQDTSWQIKFWEHHAVWKSTGKGRKRVPAMHGMYLSYMFDRQQNTPMYNHS